MLQLCGHSILQKEQDAILDSLKLRRPYTALTTLTLVALVINALAYASEFMLLGLDLQIGIVVIVLIVATILVATGWRWTPVLALIAGGILLGNPYLQHNLSLPVASGFFLAALPQVISGLIAAAVGIGATVQNYRSEFKNNDKAT